MLEKRGNGYEILVGKPKGRRCGGDPRIGRRLILDWFKKNQVSLIQCEEHRLRMSEDKAPRSTLQSERQRVTEDCRKLHKGELHDLYSSPNIIRIIK
jgi:hypothetical protein